VLKEAVVPAVLVPHRLVTVQTVVMVVVVAIQHVLLLML
jgi:hypothetical protein